MSEKDRAIEELIDLLPRLTQDLQEYADAGREAGNPISDTEELIQEASDLMIKLECAWQSKLSNGYCSSPGIDAL